MQIEWQTSKKGNPYYTLEGYGTVTVFRSKSGLWTTCLKRDAHTPAEYGPDFDSQAEAIAYAETADPPEADPEVLSVEGARAEQIAANIKRQEEISARAGPDHPMNYPF